MAESAELRRRVIARFLAVNGRHAMSPADDAYVDRHFRPIGALCADRPETPDEVRSGMLAGRLPLPSYLRSDDVEMLPPDYFRLADEAGGTDRLPTWFSRHWADREQAAEEWRCYLDGQYVCLRSVTPALMRRKDELVALIGNALAAPEPRSPGWLAGLHALVDELDRQTADFTAYDRLRFGGPVSRDTFIDAVRARHPR